MAKKSSLVSKLFSGKKGSRPTIPLVTQAIRQGRPQVSAVKAVRSVTRTLTGSGDVADASPNTSRTGTEDIFEEQRQKTPVDALPRSNWHRASGLTRLTVAAARAAITRLGT